MRKLRVIHYGIAHDHSVFAMQMLRRYPDVFEIVGVCEPDETARQVFGGKDEYAGLPWLSEDEVLSREDSRRRRDRSWQRQCSTAFPRR